MNIECFKNPSTEELKNILEATKSLVTTIAILTGGLWTYNLFIKKRQGFPKIKLTHNMFCLSLNRDKCLIHIEITIVNKGNILAILNKAEIGIYQILPLSSNLKNLINKESLVNLSAQNSPLWTKGKAEISWELIGWNNSILSRSDKIELEPGEEDRVCCDFIVSSQTKVIELYSYFKNIHKKEIGWGLTTIHKIKTI